MLDTSIVRCDHDGRLVIPARFRRELNVPTGAYLTVDVCDGSIVLTPVMGIVTSRETPPPANFTGRP